MRICAFLFLAASTFTLPAFAAPASLAHSLSPQSKALYDEGRALYAKGDYASALDRFKRAHDGTSDPRLLWNMAACEHKLGHDVRMLHLLREYLETGGSLLTDSDRRDASKLLSTVRAQVATLALTTDPDGANVEIDGEQVATTPLNDPLLVDPGDHRIRVSKTGYQDETRSQSFPNGEQVTLSVTLHPTPLPTDTLPTAAAPPSSTAPQPVLPEAPPPPRSTTPLIVAGAGLVGVVGGGVLAILSASRYSSLHGSCAPKCDPSSWKTWQTLEPVGWTLIGLGGVALAAGLVWEFAPPLQTSTDAAFYVAPTLGGAIAGARF